MTNYSGEAGKDLANKIVFVRCNQPLQYVWDRRLGPILGRCETVYDIRTGDAISKNQEGLNYDPNLQVHIPENEIYNLDGGLGCAGHNYIGRIVVPIEKVSKLQIIFQLLFLKKSKLTE